MMSKKVNGSEVSGGDGDGVTRVVSWMRRRGDAAEVPAAGSWWRSGVAAMAIASATVGACRRYFGSDDRVVMSKF